MTAKSAGKATRQMVFEQKGDFEAVRYAEGWLKANGYSFGRMQGASPRGILKGYHDIMKWRNLTTAEVAALDGRMTGNMRNGPVIVTIIRGAQ